jgi:transcriptional accessory protein Tex/SPT6
MAPVSRFFNSLGHLGKGKFPNGDVVAHVTRRRGIIGDVSEPESDEWRAFRERRKPTEEEWAAAKSRFASGVVVTGVVLSHHVFGFFVDLGYPILGLVEVSRVKESGQPVDSRDYPPVGQETTAVVLGAIDLQHQVRLSTRPSDLAAT